MKDYKRLVLWADYFNSSLSRKEGRRIPLDRSVKDPKPDELAEASRRAGYSPELVEGNFPIRMMVKSGYVSVEKRNNAKKKDVIEQVAKSLSAVRGERSATAATGSSTGSNSQKLQGKVQSKK